MEESEQVYCDVHGAIHRKDGTGTEVADPECDPTHWRKVWIGAYVPHEQIRNDGCQCECCTIP